MKKYLGVILGSAFLFSTSAFALDYTIEEPYLTLEESIDSAAILPPPPSIDSVTFLADKAAFEQGRTMAGTARWQMAIEDALLSDANMAKTFSEPFGLTISKENTPETYVLMEKIHYDFSDWAVKRAKVKYLRIRPFKFYNTTTCTPGEDPDLLRSGSYPSGHTSFGWALAMVLAELNPAKANAVLERGYEFGQSRVICGAHWQSDVNAGRVAAAAELAVLRAHPGFQAQLAKAKAEVAKLLAAQK